MNLTCLNHIYDINLNHPLSNIFQADDVMHIEPSSISTCPPPAAQWTTVLPCRSTARDTSQPFRTNWHLVGRLNGKINENCWEFTQKLTRNDQKHPNHHWKCIAIWTKNIPPHSQTPKFGSVAWMHPRCIWSKSPSLAAWNPGSRVLVPPSQKPRVVA